MFPDLSMSISSTTPAYANDSIIRDFLGNHRVICSIGPITDKGALITRYNEIKVQHLLSLNKYWVRHRVVARRVSFWTPKKHQIDNKEHLFESGKGKKYMKPGVKASICRQRGNKAQLNSLPQLHGSDRDTSGEFRTEVIITKIYANYQPHWKDTSFIVAFLFLTAAKSSFTSDYWYVLGITCRI